MRTLCPRCWQIVEESKYHRGPHCTHSMMWLEKWFWDDRANNLIGSGRAQLMFYREDRIRNPFLLFMRARHLP